jgi:hypothetical protein
LKLPSGFLSNYSGKHKTGSTHIFQLGMRQITKQETVNLLANITGVILHCIIALAKDRALFWERNVAVSRAKLLFFFFF